MGWIRDIESPGLSLSKIVVGGSTAAAAVVAVSMVETTTSVVSTIEPPEELHAPIRNMSNPIHERHLI
jgi:hypothetical protein